MTQDVFLRRFTEGYRIAFGHQVLRSLLINATWFNLFEQLMITTFLVYAVRYAGLTNGTVGIVVGAGASGAILGAAVSGRATRTGLRTRLILCSGLASISPSALIMVIDDRPWSIAYAIAAFFFYGMGIASYNVIAISLRQSVTPHADLGKVGATYRMFAYGAIAGGAALSGVLIGVAGEQGALATATLALIAGWIVMSCVLGYALTPKRIHEEAP